MPADFSTQLTAKVELNGSWYDYKTDSFYGLVEVELPRALVASFYPGGFVQNLTFANTFAVRPKSLTMDRLRTPTAEEYSWC